MKRVKTLLTALAAIIGIGGSIAATSAAGPYYYTLTTGGEAYEYNTGYSSENCIEGGNNYCEITTTSKDPKTNPTATELFNTYGGTGYGAGEYYAY